MGLVAGCSEKKPAPPKAESVGTIASKQGSVDHRPAKTLTWSSAEKSGHLFHRDALKTGAGSRAVVAFKGGGKLVIDERSLVVIEAPPKKDDPKTPGKSAPPVARVEQGTVEGVVKPGAAPVRIVSADGKTTEIKADGDTPVAYRVRAKKGGLEVAVLKGSAQVTSGGKTTQVAKHQAVDVSGGKVSAPIKLLSFPELSAPGVDAKIPENDEIKLAWRSVQGAVRYRIQLSNSIDFSSVLFSTSTTAVELTIKKKLSREVYVWRVSSIDKDGREGEFGFARRFSLVDAKPIETKDDPVSPANNAAVEYIKEPRPTTFSWEGNADKYVLVVAKHPRLRGRPVIKRPLKTTSYTVKRLKPGVYFWGVYGVNKAGKKSLLAHGVRRLVVAWRRPPKVNVPGIKWK